jgi:hypothetical protein
MVFVNIRNRALRLATLLVAAAAPLVAQASPLTFEQAFDDRGEPKVLHYQAVFVSRGVEHRLEVWRDGDRRLRRRADEAVETYALREPGQAEFRLSVLDLKKRIHTRIDRTNLYRIGSFTDWFDLAHGLKHPKGTYQLARAKAPLGIPRAIEPCEWYDLTQGQHTTQICWSRRSRLPLVIRDPGGAVVWKVASLDRSPLPATTFEIHDEGFVRNDANQDIEGD